MGDGYVKSEPYTHQGTITRMYDGGKLGEILGTDGKKYTFARTDHNSGMGQVGEAVDFDGIDGRATHVDGPQLDMPVAPPQF